MSSVLDLPLVELVADDGAEFPVDDPATGETITTVPRMGAAETGARARAAEEALPAWRGLLAKERAGILRRWADLMIENEDLLARLLTTEQGKPLAESRIEVAYAASFLEWFGEEGKRVYGDTIPTYLPDRRIVVTKEPDRRHRRHHAVELPRRHADSEGRAGARGRLHDGAEARRADTADRTRDREAGGGGRPAGGRASCIVTGNAEDAPVIGRAMTSSPIVRKLGFTGSTEVGKLLMAQCAAGMKKVSLELGGNAPFIVFDDADLDEAVAGALLCKFRNSGQTCISANRIYVQSPVYDEFVERLTDAVRGLKVGSGLEADSKIGPLIERQAVDKVERHVADALERGGELLTGGEALGGLFYAPTVITGVTADAAMASEETFGPVAGIARFDTEQEAVRQANDTPYGLASYFYSRDIGRIWRVSEGLEYGIVGINTGVISTEVAPFGGVKESGIGREGSKYGIDEWLEIKYLCMGGI